jgi:hypothetical protein
MASDDEKSHVHDFQFDDSDFALNFDSPRLGEEEDLMLTWEVHGLNVSQRQFRRSRALWDGELLFGEIGIVSSADIDNAIADFPGDEQILKAWWRFQSRELRPLFQADPKSNVDSSWVIGSARKLDAFARCSVPTATAQCNGRLIEISKQKLRSDHTVAGTGTKQSSLVPGATIRSGTGPTDLRDWQYGHSTLIHAAAVVIDRDRIVAIGPLRKDAVLAPIANHDILVSRIELGELKQKAQELSAFDAMNRRNASRYDVRGGLDDHRSVRSPTLPRGNGPGDTTEDVNNILRGRLEKRDVKTETVALPVDGAVFRIFEEAATNFGQGSRSLTAVGIVASSKAVSFVPIGHYLPLKSVAGTSSYRMGEIGFDVFTAQIANLELTATKKVDEKLLKQCEVYLGMTEGASLDDEAIAIRDKFFEIMKPHRHSSIQMAWEDLSEGISNTEARSAVLGYYGM